MAEERKTLWAETIVAFKIVANHLDKWVEDIECCHSFPPSYMEMSNVEWFDEMCRNARACFVALQYQSENPILFRKFEL